MQGGEGRAMKAAADDVKSGSPVRRGRRRALWNAAVATAVAVMLAGCVSSPPKALYDLSASTAAPAAAGTPTARPAAKASRVQLLVPEPRALAALNTNSIAAKSSPSAISYYQNVLWADQLPRVVQARVVESLENSGRVHAVGVPGQGLLINYQVLIDIRAFQFDAYRGRRGVVEFSVQILDDSNGRVVASQVFRGESRASSETADAAVAAMDAALGQVLAQMVPWIDGAV